MDKDITDTMMDCIVYAGMFAVAIITAAFVVQRLPVVQSAQRYFTSQQYLGNVVSNTLRATDKLKSWDLVNSPPYTPLISAYFFNDGPNSVFIGINNPDELTKIAPGESTSIDMSGASRWIEFVFYKCNPRETASVRVAGKY